MNALPIIMPAVRSGDDLALLGWAAVLSDKGDVEAATALRSLPNLERLARAAHTVLVDRWGIRRERVGLMLRHNRTGGLEWQYSLVLPADGELSRPGAKGPIRDFSNPAPQDGILGPHATALLDRYDELRAGIECLARMLDLPVVVIHWPSERWPDRSCETVIDLAEESMPAIPGAVEQITLRLTAPVHMRK